MEISLTQNGIIHISAGFDGPFVLQAFSVRKNPTIANQLNMCLTDGIIYIGASYVPPKFFQLDNFNIVKVTAQYFDRMRPIVIKSLQIVSRTHRKLIGNAPCTLSDYFNNEMLSQPENEPKKKVKISLDQFSPVVMPQLILFQTKPQKINVDQFEPIKEMKKQKQKQKQKPKNEKQNKKSLKKLKLDSEQDQDFGGDLHSSSLDNFKATFVKDSVSTANTVLPFNMQDMVENSFIRDLFQRHTGWIILCRVNYRSLAKCENGMYAVNFVLTDESRDQIKCVLFEADLQKAKELLSVGKYYLFTCGEVKEYHEGELQIIFDKNSHFLQKENVHFGVNPKKLTRINKILEESPDHDINVIGIVRKIKNRGEKLKTKSKYVATICDPITNYEIDFLLFLNDDDKPIERGMIVVLHSYQIYKLNNICRLNSTYRSYYYEQRPNAPENKQDLVNQFYKYIQLNTWDNENYRNISMFAFTQRPIQELKTIHKRTDDDRVYSSVDCWIMEISRKKSYYACKTCKKPTQKKQMSGLFFCIHCKKMVDVLLTLTLSVTFTDSTGSCMIDVIGQHAENIIQKRALQFYALPIDQQNHHLESLRYKNVQLRLKTQRKNDGKLGHSVWGIERTRPEIPLKEIQKLLSEKSAKLDDKW